MRQRRSGLFCCSAQLNEEGERGAERDGKTRAKKAIYFRPAAAAREEAAGTGLTGNCAENPVSQSLDEKAAISLADWLEAECNFRSIDPSQVEACCLYEYFRESTAMREAFKPIAFEPVSTGMQGRTEFKVVGANERLMPLKGYLDEDFYDYTRLRITLTKAGFPVPWNRLTPDQRKELANVLAWRAKDKLKHPPLIVSKLPLECFYHPDVQDEVLKRWWEKTYVSASFSDAESSETLEEFLKKGTFPYCDGHTYSYCLFRLDESYNEGEAVEAFREWFAKQYPKRQSGNPHWFGKLKQLVAMRVRHRYPRSERRAILLSLTSKKTYQHGINETVGRATGKMDVGLSRDCREAREFFHTLFHGEQPISFSPRR